MSDLTDTKLDVYRVGRLLGSGGMAEVYEGKHTLIGRRCALKVLHEVLQKNEEGLTRMIREAQAASAIGHPNIVDVFDFRRAPNGKYFMVMELLYGEPLSDFLDEHEILDIRFSLAVGAQILSALQSAHSKGIVHRDMKPGNVFIAKARGPGHLIKLLDFGISKFVHDTREDMRLTKTGMVLGTPYYMSPEQAAGKQDVDARADIWSCGVILYEMLTGLVPFDGENYNEVMVNIVTKDFERPSLHRDNLPKGIDEIIVKAMTKERGERYQTPQEMYDDLEPLVTQEEVKQGPYILRPMPFVPEPGAEGAAESLPDIEAFDFDDLEPGRRPTKRERPAYPSTRVLWGTSKQRDMEAETRREKTGKDKKSRGGLSRGTLTDGESVGIDITSEQNTLSVEAAASRRPIVYAVGGGIVVAVVAAALIIGLYLGRKSEPAAGRGEDRYYKTAHVTPGPTRDGSAAHTEARPDAAATALKTRKTRRKPRPDGSVKIDAGPPTITIKLINLPNNATIKVDKKEVTLPVRVRKDGKRHCITISRPRYWPFHRCFRAHKNITYKVKMWIKWNKPRKTKYDSPYGP
jgi:serine/threonine-protein kinase